MTLVALKNEFCFCCEHQSFSELTQKMNSVEVDSSDRGGHVLRPVINLIIKLNPFSVQDFNIKK